jgi:hypothetical protein
MNRENQSDEILADILKTADEMEETMDTTKLKETMDTTKLEVGWYVFMRSGEADWCTVVEVTPAGVIVQSDPAYGDELIRFDKNGTACDSSDLDVERYKDLVLYDEGKPMRDVVDIERVKAVVSQYVEGRDIIPRAVNDKRNFRQRFWENFERLKKHSRYSKIPSGSVGPWRLYLSPDDGDNRWTPEMGTYPRSKS